MPPNAAEIKAERGSSLIAATDGFWTELTSEEQAMFMQGQFPPMIGEADDRSVLAIELLDNEQDIEFCFNEDRSENFYIGRP
jgi:hypothetical protein